MLTCPKIQVSISQDQESKEGVMPDTIAKQVPQETRESKETCGECEYYKDCEPTNASCYGECPARKHERSLRKVLESLRLEHHECQGDPWFSCPISEDGCADETREGCTCGAEAHNNKITQALAHHCELTLKGYQSLDATKTVEGE